MPTRRHYKTKDEQRGHHEHAVKPAGKAKTYIILALAVLSGTLVFYSLREHHKVVGLQKAAPGNGKTESVTMVRDHSKKLIAPILLVKLNKESEKFQGLKSELDASIRQWESRGVVQSVSVFLRDLISGEWFSINEREEYFPGSLLKLPIMITWLREEMEKPGTLGKELLYIKPVQNLPSQVFENDSIISGKKYKVSELIKFMIINSDNNATYLLIRNLDQVKFRELFASLQLAEPDLYNVNYTISARDFSRFLGILYSSTWLSDDLSEYALELLSRVKFSQGMTSDLPGDLLVAHKFGEHSLKNTGDFSESGIIYRAKGPFVITIMTRGCNIREQARMIGQLSRLTLDHYPADLTQ